MPEITALRQLLDHYLDPVMKPRGYRRVGNNYRRGKAPEATLVVEFRSFPLPAVIGFYLEWRVDVRQDVPDERTEAERQATAEAVRAGLGIVTPGGLAVLGSRIPMPPHLADPLKTRQTTTWTIPLDEIDRYAAMLVNRIVGDYLPMWDRLSESPAAEFAYTRAEMAMISDSMMPQSLAGRRLSLELIGTPRFRLPAPDRAQFDAWLAELEATHPTNEWVRWWRETMHQSDAYRSAADGASPSDSDRSA